MHNPLAVWAGGGLVDMLGDIMKAKVWKCCPFLRARQNGWRNK